MGRRKLEVDKCELSKWARAGATQEEMAARLGVSPATLARRLATKEYRELLPVAKAELKISLRTKQVQMALNGNVTMLIWLGKNLLGQTDAFTSKVEHSGPGGAPIEVVAQIRAAILHAVADLPEETRAVVAQKLLQIDA